MAEEKVLSFGELLLRICPDMDGQWINENRLPFYIGGAELNVATALALWDVPVAYLTALPENFLSEQLIRYVNGKNIDSSRIIFHGERVGTYYLPKGKDLKNAGVIYDRKGSAFAELTSKKINWDEVFRGVSWFHFSAICPALNQNVADVCEVALKEASKRNIFISLDLNYRAKLWKYGKEPHQVMPALAKYCNLIMGNIWAAEKMLGTGLDEELVYLRNKESLLTQAEATSREILRKYKKCKVVANTFRFDHGYQGIKYFTTLYTGSNLYYSQEYLSEKITDKVGSGDCFMAGLIYGFYNQHSPQQTLEFATAAAFRKLFIESDATTDGVEDIQKTIATYAG
jgi:2-dehydro-3-deoxygluconokinase